MQGALPILPDAAQASWRQDSGERAASQVSAAADAGRGSERMAVSGGRPAQSPVERFLEGPADRFRTGVCLGLFYRRLLGDDVQVAERHR